MTRRALALAVFASSVLCFAAAAVVPFLWGAGAHALGSALVSEGSFGLPYVLVGLVITIRRPRHPIGWGFALTGLCFAIQAASGAYADAAFRPGGPDLVAAAYGANLTQWIFAPGVLLGFTLPFLWFPEGKVLSPRWRVVGVVAVASTAVMCAVNIVAPGPLNNYKHATNPLAVDVPGAALLQLAGILTYVGSLFAAAAAVVIRFRRSHGLERLQMRWFMVGVAGTVVAFAAQMVTLAFTGDVGPAVGLLAVLPICSAIAILRYRLFDIDRVISRTVTYAGVTAFVGAPYVVLTILAGRLAHGSEVTVAALTLVTLAVLRPVHRRVQVRVDRRFNRESYDAARTIDHFAVRLRDEVDPDLVTADLLSVAARAMQPASLSLWVVS